MKKIFFYTILIVSIMAFSASTVTDNHIYTEDVMVYNDDTTKQKLDTVVTLELKLQNLKTQQSQLDSLINQKKNNQ